MHPNGTKSEIFNRAAIDPKAFKAALLEQKGFVEVFGLPEPRQQDRKNDRTARGLSHGI